MSFAQPPETLKVNDLGQQDDRRQRIDVAEAPEPAHRLTIRRRIGEGLQFLTPKAATLFSKNCFSRMRRAVGNFVLPCRVG